MMYVYVLQSKRVGFFYVGMTHDVPLRLRQHNKGQSRSTRGYRPWEVFFYEEYPDVSSARKRELYLKSALGREYIRKRWLTGSRKKLKPA